MMELEEH